MKSSRKSSRQKAARSLAPNEPTAHQKTTSMGGKRNGGLKQKKVTETYRGNQKNWGRRNQRISKKDALVNLTIHEKRKVGSRAARGKKEEESITTITGRRAGQGKRGDILTASKAGQITSIREQSKGKKVRGKGQKNKRKE